jgi:ABC-type transporter Mla maintaining outer membrane lipid asymmetry ATPase subunit MlaF
VKQPGKPANETRPACVEMNDVAVGESRRSGAPSVEDINWTVHSGDYWVVGGAPGSGKSDLLATVAGLLRPLRGTLRLFGLDRVDTSQEELVASRAEIGLVFENGGRPFEHLTVAENVALPLCYRENCSPEDGIPRPCSSARLIVWEVIRPACNSC